MQFSLKYRIVVQTATVFLLTAVFGAGTICAQNYWTGSGGGSWHNHSNWSDGVPGSGSLARFIRSDSGVVTATGNVSIGTMYILNGLPGSSYYYRTGDTADVTLDMNGHSFSAGSTRLGLGQPGNSGAYYGNLHLRNGDYSLGSVTHTAGSYLRVQSGATVTTGTLYGNELGYNGISSWSSTFVEGGATLNTGTITFDAGRDAHRLLVQGNLNSLSYASHDGQGGTGLTAVYGNAVWNNAGDLNISNYDTSASNTTKNYLNLSENATVNTGSLTVSGSAGSNANAYVQVNQDATLNVSDTLRVGGGSTNASMHVFGNVTSKNLHIANDSLYSQYSGSVTIDGGTFQTGQDVFVVGASGSPTLELKNGGSLVKATGTNTKAVTVGDTSGTTGTLNVNGGALTTSEFVLVGQDGTGNLNVTNGGSVTAGINVAVGNGAGTGTATVTGSGSLLRSEANTDVGFLGRGTLNVNSGGDVEVGNLLVVSGQPSGEGTVNIDGVGSTITSTSHALIGNNGVALVNITNGGLLASNETIAVGVNSGALAVVQANGTGSELRSAGTTFVGDAGIGDVGLNSGKLVVGNDLVLGNQSTGNGDLFMASDATANVSGTAFVGLNGTGRVQIAGGSSLDANVVAVGNNSNSTGTLTVKDAGSKLTSTFTTRVGLSGTGTVTVENGGAAESGNHFIVGANSTGTGTVTVTGNGSRISSGTVGTGNLVVGRQGDGTLNVLNGGRADTSNHLNLAQAGGSVGRLNIDGSGSIVAVTNSAHIGGTAVTAGGIGTVNITNGGALAVGDTLKIYSGSSVTVDAASTLTATNIVADGALNWADGALDVGAGQTLSGSGDFSGIDMVTISNGGLIAPGNSTGTLTGGAITWAPGGIFDFEINDFNGTAGSNTLGWDLLMADSINITSTLGNPFGINLLSLTSGQAAGAADNFDGMSPYSLMFASTTGGVTGFNSGLFSIDTSGFQNAYTGSWSVSQTGNDLFVNYATSAAVPEPSSFAILGLGGIGLLVARRRKRQNVQAS